MKRTNTGIPLASRAAWMGLVLLLGLLLSACETAGVNQPRRCHRRPSRSKAASEGEQAAAVLRPLPEKYLLVDNVLVDNDGRIRRFDRPIPGCDITGFEIPMVKGGTRIVAIHNEAFRGKRLTKLIISNSVTTIGPYAFADNPIVRVILDPHPNLTFDNTSFPNNLWDAFSQRRSKEAGPGLGIASLVCGFCT